MNRDDRDDLVGLAVVLGIFIAALAVAVVVFMLIGKAFGA